MSADYGSSEGWIGANVNPSLPPELATFAVLPNIGYFEFIPLEKSEVQEPEKSASTIHYIEAEPIGLTEVEVGKEYEIVMTNFAGIDELYSPHLSILLIFFAIKCYKNSNDGNAKSRIIKKSNNDC